MPLWKLWLLCFTKLTKIVFYSIINNIININNNIITIKHLFTPLSNDQLSISLWRNCSIIPFTAIVSWEERACYRENTLTSWLSYPTSVQHGWRVAGSKQRVRVWRRFIRAPLLQLPLIWKDHESAATGELDQGLDFSMDNTTTRLASHRLMDTNCAQGLLWLCCSPSPRHQNITFNLFARKAMGLYSTVTTIDTEDYTNEYS